MGGTHVSTESGQSTDSGTKPHCCRWWRFVDLLQDTLVKMFADVADCIKELDVVTVTSPLGLWTTVLKPNKNFGIFTIASWFLVPDVTIAGRDGEAGWSTRWI